MATWVKCKECNGEIEKSVCMCFVISVGRQSERENCPQDGEQGNGGSQCPGKWGRTSSNIFSEGTMVIVEKPRSYVGIEL